MPFNARFSLNLPSSGLPSPWMMCRWRTPARYVLMVECALDCASSVTYKIRVSSVDGNGCRLNRRQNCRNPFCAELYSFSVDWATPFLSRRSACSSSPRTASLAVLPPPGPRAPVVCWWVAGVPWEKMQKTSHIYFWIMHPLGHCQPLQCGWQQS